MNLKRFAVTAVSATVGFQAFNIALNALPPMDFMTNTVVGNVQVIDLIDAAVITAFVVIGNSMF